MFTIERGNLWNQTHTQCKNLILPDNLATDEENIDVPNAMVKRSHGINVHNLIKTFVLIKHAHDGTKQLVESNNSSTHTVKEQFVPEEHRDNASFNADNEFNLPIDDEKSTSTSQECRIQQ